MRSTLFGIVVGTVALIGVVGSLAVLTSLYREASCFIRVFVVGIAVALMWKAAIAFSHPRWIDEADGLLVLGITVVYWRRLLLDAADGFNPFLRGPR